VTVSGEPGPVRRTSRRAVLAGLGAAALGAACGAPTSSAQAGPALHTDWTTKPDGALPAVGDEGRPFVVTLSGPDRGPRVTGSALVADLPQANAATYLNQDLGAQVRRIGAEFAFGPGTANGSLCLAAWSGALPPPPGPIAAPCHFVLTPDHWIYGVALQGRVIQLANRPYGRTLPQDGTPLRVDLTIAGGTATCHLPDGSTRTVTDPRIASIPGTVPCWEFYRDGAGDAEVRLRRTWADR
jgi:hypothetical protein